MTKRKDMQRKIAWGGENQNLLKSGKKFKLYMDYLKRR